MSHATVGPGAARVSDRKANRCDQQVNAVLRDLTPSQGRSVRERLGITLS